MADEKEKKPLMKSISPDKGAPGTTITIDGENLDMVTKVKIHDQWTDFKIDKGKLKVTIPQIGASLCVITLGWPTGHINNRACGLQPFRNMTGESIEVAPAAPPTA